MIAVALALQARLTMGDVVTRALERYPTVAAARAAREGAAADVTQARAASLPRLSLDAQATQNQLPNLVYPLHSLPTGPTSPLPVFDQTLYQGTAFLNWTFYDFGARGRRTSASRELADAADAALGSAEQQLIARAAQAYLQVVGSRELLAAQDQRLAALAAEETRTSRLLAEGKTARVELLRAQATLARARADRSATAGQLDVAEHDLARLADIPADSIATDSLPSAALTDTTVPPRATLVDRAIEASPAVLEARRRAGAARSFADAARATRLPELRLSAGIVDRGAPGQDLKAEWQAGLEVAYPLYTGGQRGGQIARAEADARAAAEQLRLAELAAGQDVDRAMASVTEAHARVAALISAVQQSEAVADVERTSLEVGSGTQTDYLDALAQLLQARSSLIDARHAEIAAHIELARVTGDLSPAWLSGNLELSR